MSHSAKAYNGDLMTFLDQATLNEIRNALYAVAKNVEDGRASGCDFYSELLVVLEAVCERGIDIGKRTTEQQIRDHAKAVMELLKCLEAPTEGSA